MQVTLTARQCTVQDGTRAHAERRVSRLRRIETRPMEVELAFAAEHGERRVEARLGVAGAGIYVARGSAPTFRTALDRAVERLEKQLKRDRERRRVRRASVSA